MRSRRVWAIPTLLRSHVMISTFARRRFCTRRRRPAVVGDEFLFGIQPCLLALQAARRTIFDVYVKSDYANARRSPLHDVVKIAQTKGIPVRGADKGRLGTMSEGRPHQGVVMKVGRLNYEPISYVKKELDNGRFPLWVLLDAIQDPMNVGAVLRTCCFLGVDKVVVCNKNCAPLTPTVSKASAGAIEAFPVYSTSSSIRFIKECLSAGWSVVGGSSANHSKSNSEIIDCSKPFSIPHPVLLVLGNEGYGLRPSVANICSHLIHVPPSEGNQALNFGLDSLNVSVATGILVFRLKQEIEYALN
ncbi:rRNA methyltransferase 1, mitochondrial-like [Oscarella lobularis]|uniref:rRNA methyltransferase 1, mitochondrial-like n=1 Tax=Oscarella lobularis TaxID=121494 RepID=UPI0033141C7F